MLLLLRGVHCDHGNCATILLYNLDRGTVVLVRQFRFPAFVNGHSGMLIETAAGSLDLASPEDRIRVEAEEETGYRVSQVRKVFEAFMSPGSVTEKLYFFIAEYRDTHRSTSGGGNRSEGEDIEVLETPIEEAMKAIRSGDIMDGKTAQWHEIPLASSLLERAPATTSQVRNTNFRMDFPNCRFDPPRPLYARHVDQIVLPS